MSVKESSILQEALQTKDMHSTIYEDDEDETLSLCDLPLYSDRSATEWYEDLSTESQGSSSVSSTDHDYFEFFSQELNPYITTTTTATFPPENIIFCGKIIPHKQPNVFQKDSSTLVESKKQTNKTTRCIVRLLTWDFRSSRSSKNGERSAATVKQKKDRHFSTSLHQSPKKIYNNEKHGKSYDLFPIHKMSTLTSSSLGKPRWYLGLFGISKLSMDVQWTDMKRRQSHRQFPSPPPSPRYTFQNEDKKVGGGWRLITALSCGGNQETNTMGTTRCSSKIDSGTLF